MSDKLKLLDGGVAEYMGEGVFVILQQSEKGPQNVVVTEEDLRALLALRS